MNLSGGSAAPLSRARIIAIAVAALLLTVVFILAGTPDGSSRRFNLSWSAAFGEMIWQGVLYPRFLPGLWSGTGGHDFFFYAPIPFWIDALFAQAVCWNCSVDRSFALAGSLMIIFSGLAFFPFARRILRGDSLAALVASLAYAFAPYHVWVDWFVRQAAGEVAAYIFLPVIATGFLRIAENRSIGVLALGWAGLMLCHLPTALLAAHILPATALTWAIHERRTGRVLKVLGQACLAVGLGAGLAAIYWLPAIVLLPGVSSEMLYLPYFDAHRWLFFDFQDEPDRALTFNLQVLLLGSVAVAALLPAFARSLGGAGWRSPVIWQWVAAPLAASFFLMSVLSLPIWTGWVLAKVQFPWRAMVFVDFALAVALGMSFSFGRSWQARRLRLWTLLGFSTLVVFVIPSAVVTVLDEPMLSWKVQPGGAVEYLPRGFVRATGAANMPNHIETELAITRWVDAARQHPGTIVPRFDYRTLEAEVEPGKREGLIVLPFHERWQGVDDQGRQIELSLHHSSGLTRVRFEDGAATLRLALPRHWSEWAGTLTAALAALATMFLVWRRRIRARRGVARAPDASPRPGDDP